MAAKSGNSKKKGAAVSGGGLSGNVFDIKRYAIHDGPGIRTTVFFKGCPLRCRWCHNPESWLFTPQHGLRAARCVGCRKCIEVCPAGAISIVDDRPVTDSKKCKLSDKCIEVCPAGAREIIGREMQIGEVVAEIERDRVFYDESGGGATFSGGEPLSQPNFLAELLKRCRAKDIHTAVDTTCYAEPDIIKRISQNTDLFLCDIKHMDSKVHKQFTGVGNEIILANITWLASSDSEIVIRLPLIPGFNDGEANITATAEFVDSLGALDCIDILPYNPGGIEKASRLTGDYEMLQYDAVSDEKLEAVEAQIESFGFEIEAGTRA